MRRYLFAAISSLIMVEPVVALDLGVGVKSGGISVGASVGVGKKGASLGLGAGLGSTGVTAGASVDNDKAGVSASVTSGSKVGGLSVGATTGKSSITGGSVNSTSTSGISSAVGGATSGSKASKGSTSASKSKDQDTAKAIVRTVVAKGDTRTLSLPRSLLPVSDRSGRETDGALKVVPGTPIAVVRSCRDAVEKAATEFGVVSVQAKSAGTLRRLNGGFLLAPVEVRVHYERLGGAETRQARIKCQLDSAGTVVKLT